MTADQPDQLQVRERRAAARYGLSEAEEGGVWTLFWTDSSVSLDHLSEMRSFQKINHFPGMSELSRKDLLARNMKRMMRRFPKDYAIFPPTWCLPADYHDFQVYLRSKKHRTFICKPEASSQGRGIFLTRSCKEISHQERMICQLYISRPFVIDGFKFDLRVYVLVTSCDPLRIFLYKEGLARFCTTRYSYPTRSNLEDVCMHLTNYAINKRSKNFVRDDIIGSKRKLSSVTRLLDEMHWDTAKLWADIEDVVIKTLLSAHSGLSHSYHACFPRHIATSSAFSACFEILGFDVLLDHRLKPWLLEVNHSPSFATDSYVDREVKDSLLYDTLVLINLGTCDRLQAAEKDLRHAQNRLQRTRDRRSQDHCQKRAGSLERALSYEDQHLGGFRRIYPCEGGERGEGYAQYLQHSGSLFQDTAASRARGKCTRDQLRELQEKQEQKRGGPGARGHPGETAGEGGGLGARGHQGETIGERGAEAKRVRLHISHKHNSSQHQEHIPHLHPGLMTVTRTLTEEEEEEERVRGLRDRGILLRELGIVDQIYKFFKSTVIWKDITAPPVKQGPLGDRPSGGVEGERGQCAVRDWRGSQGRGRFPPRGGERREPCPAERQGRRTLLPISSSVGKLANRTTVSWLLAELQPRAQHVLALRPPRAPLPQVAEGPPRGPLLHVVSGPAPVTRRHIPLRTDQSETYKSWSHGSLRPRGSCGADLGDKALRKAVRYSHDRLLGNLETQPIISDTLVSKQRLVDTEDIQTVPSTDQVGGWGPDMTITNHCDHMTTNLPTPFDVTTHRLHVDRPTHNASDGDPLTIYKPADHPLPGHEARPRLLKNHDAADATQRKALFDEDAVDTDEREVAKPYVDRPRC